MSVKKLSFHHDVHHVDHPDVCRDVHHGIHQVMTALRIASAALAGGDSPLLPFLCESLCVGLCEVVCGGCYERVCK